MIDSILLLRAVLDQGLKQRISKNWAKELGAIRAMQIENVAERSMY